MRALADMVDNGKGLTELQQNICQIKSLEMRSI
jgi:hypothetical protein